MLNGEVSVTSGRKIIIKHDFNLYQDWACRKRSQFLWGHRCTRTVQQTQLTTTIASHFMFMFTCFTYQLRLFAPDLVNLLFWVQAHLWALPVLQKQIYQTNYLNSKLKSPNKLNSTHKVASIRFGLLLFSNISHWLSNDIAFVLINF